METVERHVTLPADLREAWGLLTDPRDLAAWLGRAVVLDPVPGAAGEVVDHDGTHRRLVIDEVEDNRRLRWRWWIDGDDPSTASHVEISLSPTPDGTQVTVVEQLPGSGEQTPSAPPQASARASEAWSHRLLHLEALLLLAAAVRG